ncbi:hypothetical protein YC2023_079413 [Brassica napus]
MQRDEGAMIHLMSSSRNTSGSRRGSRRGRQSCGEARTTTDGGTTREGQPVTNVVECQMWQLEKELKKYFELIVEKSSWDPEINSKIGYLPKLWNIHGQLVKRTGVAVDPSSGQIDMIETWWSDRIAEYGGTKGRLVHVLQKKPLPFKDLSDQIFGEHDVDQDERYSPHMLGLQLQQVQPTLDVDGITMVDQMQETQTAEQIDATDQSEACRHVVFQEEKLVLITQVESGFQRVVDTRQEFLEELRSRKIQKITYGDATSVLEKLPIEQLGVFWWAANKLLKNDADVREAFLKLENEEIKIKYMESLLGTDRHGSPCNQVDLLTTSQNHIQSVGMGGITATRANTRDGFMSFLGVHSTALEEPRREPTSFCQFT